MSSAVGEEESRCRSKEEEAAGEGRVGSVSRSGKILCVVPSLTRTFVISNF